MKKLVLILPLWFSALVFAQNYTLEQVETSTDLKVVANFIKNNPNHPKTPELKQKLYTMINGNASSSLVGQKVNTTKSTSTKTNAKNSKDSKTSDVLTHLFNNNPNKTEAYVRIKNSSKCAIFVDIKGKKNYTLDITAHNENYLLLEKGTYKISTNICGATYSSTKTISQDIAITLNGG